jgi:ABC-type transporter Mla subunit MlaD
MKKILAHALFLGLIGCSDSEYYKVQFENVDRLTTGDVVIIKGLEVGQVKALTLDNEKKVLATVWVGRDIKLTKGSTFMIRSEILGQRYIEITLSDNKELLDPNEIQRGYVEPLDTTRGRALSAQEYDSLVKNDPVYKLADTLFKTFVETKDRIDRKNKKTE